MADGMHFIIANLHFNHKFFTKVFKYKQEKIVIRGNYYIHATIKSTACSLFENVDFINVNNKIMAKNSDMTWSSLNEFIYILMFQVKI